MPQIAEQLVQKTLSTLPNAPELLAHLDAQFVAGVFLFLNVASIVSTLISFKEDSSEFAALRLVLISSTMAIAHELGNDLPADVWFVVFLLTAGSLLRQYGEE